MVKLKNKNKLLDEDFYDLISARLKAFSEAIRLKILFLLLNNKKTVSEIVNKIGTSQANISKHLNILYTNKIIDKEKDKNKVYYFITDPCVENLFNCICSSTKKMLENNNKILNKLT